MPLPRLKMDLTSVMRSLRLYPSGASIPTQGLVFNITGFHDLWAVQGPFTYELVALYAREMLHFFETPGNPKCALVIQVSEHGMQVGQVELRPHFPIGQVLSEIGGVIAEI